MSEVLGPVRGHVCARCLYRSEHPLLLSIDAAGICSGCRVHEEKEFLDWDYRWRQLQLLVEPYRARGSNYDCIVPVTGAGDSYFVVHTVKNRLKMNPLLVHYNNHFSTALGMRNLANMRIVFGCDFRVQTLSPSRVKKVTAVTLADLGSVYWASHAGRTAWPVQVAVQMKIPLIIWGAHQGLEQTGQFSHLDEVEMSRRYRHDHDLMGVEPEEMVTAYGLLGEADIAPFCYPDDARLRSLGVRGIYLGNFVPWDPRAQHQAMCAQFGFRTARVPRTFDTYEHTDCWVYMSAHDMLKEARLGYGRATDHAVREIRHGRLRRDVGQRLAREALTESDAIGLKLFQEWLGLSTSGWSHLLRRWTDNSELPRDIDAEDSGPCRSLQLRGFRSAYPHSDLRERDDAPRMLLVDRGYP